MKLHVGLVAFSPMWEQLLLQEGIPFSTVNLQTLADSCSVLIVNRSVDADERSAIEAYLASGGAILGSAEFTRGINRMGTRREKIDYLASESDDIFRSVQFVDLAIQGEISSEANRLRTQSQTFAVFAGKIGGGLGVIFPFDLASTIADTRAAEKNFYATRERLPAERVSLVSKGEIHHLLHDALRYLHHARKIPYAHLWYFPDGKRNCFAFRIDSDKGSRVEVDELYAAARDHDIRMSWFLDVKSHEDWLQHFAFLSGQDFGVHCYTHRTFDTFDENVKNISKAKHKLDLAGISAPGFTAPFGMWNEELAKATEQMNFEYSSEFSYAYDAYPFYPVKREKTFSTLQIPIHPICIGSVAKVGYSEEQVKEYFRRTIDAKLLRDEPLFFYHHPTHRGGDVVRFIFAYIEQLGIDNVTFIEFARWWKKRLNHQFEIHFEEGMLTLNSQSPIDASVKMRVIQPDGREAFVSSHSDIKLSSLAWTSARPVAQTPSDIRRIREFDPRVMLGGLFTTLTRKLSERKSDE